MKDRINRILDNKFIKFLVGFVKCIVWFFVLLIIFVILVQRIFNNEVSIGSFRMFTIVSGSMEPEYQINDVIIAQEKDPSEIKEGDDLVYLGREGDFKDRIVTHRVISIINENGNYQFETQGLANEYSDPIVSSDQVYGVVVYRPIVISFLSHLLNNSYGLYFLIFIPIALLIFIEILEYIKKKEGELDNDEREEEQAKKD